MQNENELIQKLEQENSLLKKVLDLLPYGVLVKDVNSNNRYIYANKMSESLTGFSKEDLIGSKDSEVFDFLGSQSENFDKSVIAEEIPYAKYDTNVKFRSGNEGYFQILKHSIKDKKNNSSLIMAVIQDKEELKQLRTELDRNSKTMEILLENLPGAAFICTCDNDFAWEFISKGITELAGYTPDELLQNSSLSIIHPDDQAQVIKALQNAEMTCKTYLINYRIITKNGKIITVGEKGIFVVDETGLKIHGFIMDMTQIKNAHDETVENLQKIRSIIKAIPDKIAIYDQSGSFVEGDLPVELLGNFANHISLDISEKIKSFVKITLQSEETNVFELKINEDASKKYFECRLVTLTEDKVLAIFRDITATTEIRKALQNSYDLYHNLIEATEEGIAIFDKDRNLVLANKGFTDGIFNEICDNNKLNNELFFEYKSAFDSKIIGKNGKLEFYNTKTIPLNNVGDNKSGVLLISHNLTDIKEFQLELIRSKELAERSEKLKTTLFSNMGFEIRTPLNSIIGFSELLLDSSFPVLERKNFFQIIKYNSKILLDYINDVLDITLIENGKIQISKEQIGMNDLLRSINSEYSILMTTKPEVKLILNITLMDYDAMLYSDDLRIKQVIINLLDNSYKATDSGYIELGYDSELYLNKFVKLYVKDTRTVPINKLKMDDINEILTGSGNEDNQTSSNLNYWISKKLIELLGGEIWSETKDDKVSITYFTLPYLSQEKIQSNIDILLKSRFWNGKSVFINSKDYEMFFNIRQVLEKSGAEVLHSADDTQMSFALDKNFFIDVIVYDADDYNHELQVLIMSITKLYPNIKVIPLLNYNRPELIKEADALGIQYLVKPLQTAELLEYLDNIFG
ncbi:MAG: PAS domain S-box protein [bacterium]